jgi:SpoIID/LytB domain protein
MLTLSQNSPAAPPKADAAVSPKNGRYVLDGRGHGHGRGMSQWGAQGAATKGVAYQQILSTYYPGTAMGSGNDNSPIRVWISDDTDNDLRIVPSAGLTLASGNQVLPLPALLGSKTVMRWRVRLVNGVPFADGLGTDAVWRSLGMPAGSPVEFRPGTSGTVRMVLPSGNMRDYRGDLQAVPSGGRLQTVNETTMGNYLRSVVPTEVPASWLPSALNAQSVAARTYALWTIRYRNRGFADICDSTNCQVYRGVRSISAAGAVTRTWEAASTDRAVAATAGQWLSYRGLPALTEFSSSNGGQSVYGGFPYQPARPDPWDGVVKNSESAWTATLPVSRITAHWPQLGAFRSLQLTRDGQGAWGGRIVSVRLIGSKQSLTVTGVTFVNEMGLLHRWFTVR